MSSESSIDGGIIKETHGGYSPALIDRQAVRFLLDHHLGRLMTEDARLFEPYVSPVHYISDGTGGLLTVLPSSDPQLDAIGGGGVSVLSVPSNLKSKPDLYVRDSDEVTQDAIWHVQASVDVTLDTNPVAIQSVLRGQVHAVLERIAQEDGSDPASRADQSVLSELVAVRMVITGVSARLRPLATTLV